MTGTTANNRTKYLMSGAAVILIAAGAYGLGRVYPPLGPSAGTVAPAQRYVSSQVGEGDVTLGDTSIPELMQTDAFQVMVKDPNFRQLAQDPGFAALASNPAALSALAANPAAFAALAKDPSAFHSLAQQASQLAATSQLSGSASVRLPMASRVGSPNAS